MTDENADDDVERQQLDIEATPDEFMHLIGGLGQFAHTALQHGSFGMFKEMSLFQQRILKSNPEMAKHALQHDAAAVQGDFSEVLDDLDIDPEELEDDDGDDVGDAGVEIDIE